MKRTNVFLFAILLAFVVVSCDDLTNTLDSTPPEPPQGLSAFALDGSVELSWNANSEPDLKYYNVYVSDSYYGVYTFIASTLDTFYIDEDVENGNIYFYAVTAVDNDENESELSFENVSAIPRPEGFNVSIYNSNLYAENSGFSFATEAVVPFNSIDADFFYFTADISSYIAVWNDTEILDAGETTSIYDVTEVPSEGWVAQSDSLNYKIIPAIIGHTYVIHTQDNHYGKIRISRFTEQRITFDWAYQLVEGATSLKKVTLSRKHKFLKRN